MGNSRITIDVSGKDSTLQGVPEGITVHHKQRPWITGLVEQAKLRRPGP
jgi:hypothetical protein